MKRAALAVPLLALLAAPALAAAPAPAAPRILSVPRPKGGEWMGLYLQGKKAGWAFSDFREGEYEGQKAIVSTSRMTMKAVVGGADIQRDVLDERYYEDKDGGRLFALRQEKHGDGGDEVLIVRCAPDACLLKRLRPGVPDETRKLPPTGETVEHADAPRIVAFGKKPLAGVSLDLERTLADRKDLTELVGETSITAAGVTLKAIKVKTTQDESKVAMTTTFALDGRELELDFGGVMVGRVESEAVAKQLDKVDIFNLTRVVLAKPLPAEVRAAPASVVWKVTGLTADVKLDTPRQGLAAQPDGSALLTITTRLPTRLVKRPITPGDKKELADNLKSDLAVESDAPAIVAKAKEVAGDEKDAWTVARRLNLFVYKFVDSAYGASSDRATDVLATRRGDCTEHALLLTALLRASGIPARRVAGLVYMQAADGVPALYWHEWVEAWVGEWVELDPTFNQPVADPTHIALGNEAHMEDTAGLIGKLKFEVAEIHLAKPDARSKDGK